MTAEQRPSPPAASTGDSPRAPARVGESDAREAAITIAIPFYRGLGFLREAVESVRAQRHAGWRLLVVDDSARDEGAADYVRGIGDPRVTYRRNPGNLGMVRAWNRCLDEAGTDLVTLLHADDRLLPGYVALMVRLAERHRAAAALFCETMIIDERGRPIFSFADWIKRFFVPGGAPGEPVVLRGEAAVTALLRGNFIPCPTLCFRRSVLGERRFSDAWRQVQDLELTTRLLMEGETLVGVREVAYAYRRHAASATEVHSASLLRFDEEMRLFERIAERAARRGWQRAARTARRKTILRLHLGYRALTDVLHLRVGAARAKLAFLHRRR